MEYVLDRSVLESRLEALERRRWLFAHLPVDPAHLEWFRHRAWVRTVHGTTKIEGNSLTDLEVEDLLGGTSPRVPRREALEIIGSRSSLIFVDELQEGVPLDEPVIREIHRRVLDGIDPLLTPGEYRRGENRVIDAQGRTIFAGPPSGDVPSLMRDLGQWLRSGHDHLEPAAGAAVAHLEFVAIHPFNDGNGRTARGICRLMLRRGGLDFGGLVSLDGQLDRERIDYFAAIAGATGRTYAPGYDATPFATYFLDAMVRAADHVLGRMRGLGQVLIAIRRAVVLGSLPAPMLDGLAYAWINHSIRPADYARITGRAGASASRDLLRAVRRGYLEARGQTRTRRYVLGYLLRQITPDPPEERDRSP